MQLFKSVCRKLKSGMLRETDRVYTRRCASVITSDIKHSKYLALYCICHFVSCWRLSGAWCSKREIFTFDVWCVVLSPWTSKSYAVMQHMCYLPSSMLFEIGISFSMTSCPARDIVFTLGVIRKNIFVLLINQAAGYTFSGKKSRIHCLLVMTLSDSWKWENILSVRKMKKDCHGCSQNMFE